MNQNLYVDNPFQSPAILSLCTGMRGLERGLERALHGLNNDANNSRQGAIQQVQHQIRVAAYVEIEAFVIENLVRQMEQGVLAAAPVWSNLKTFPAHKFHRKIHGITGGYPCQPFSVAGNRKGTEDPRHLWPYIKDMVGAIRPVWCFFENVPGHLTLGYREVRSDLERLGYKVEEGIFSAEEVGAPHQRKRLFILALDNAYIKRWRNEQEGFIKTGLDKERNLEIQGGEWCNQQCRISKSSASEVELGYTKCNGWQGWNVNWKGTEITWSRCINSKWPARPGEQQYNWEQPRVESRLGFTVNGYNYREDLLRMAGNGVVEQTAELAFRTLIQKHGLGQLIPASL